MINRKSEEDTVNEDKPGSIRVLDPTMPAVFHPEDFSKPEVPAPTSAGVMLGVLARIAGDPAVDLERVEKILALHERLAARDSERLFTEAMAKFKESAPRIVKNKQVSFSQTHYKHATIGEVCEKVVPALAAVGISHRWDIGRTEGRLVVTCVLTHRAGHSQSTVLDGAPDNSGQKNNIQQTASTITYLQRYTLLAAVGLGVAEMDDDGSGGAHAEREPPPEGYESWVADMDAIDNEAHLKNAWNKSSGIFRAWATSVDSRWWEARKAAAKEGLTTVDYVRRHEEG